MRIEQIDVRRIRLDPQRLGARRLDLADIFRDRMRNSDITIGPWIKVNTNSGKPNAKQMSNRLLPIAFATASS